MEDTPHKNESNHEKKVHKIHEDENLKEIQEETNKRYHCFFYDDYDGVPTVWALHQMERENNKPPGDNGYNGNDSFRHQKETKQNSDPMDYNSSEGILPMEKKEIHP